LVFGRFDENVAVFGENGRFSENWQTDENGRFGEHGRTQFAPTKTKIRADIINAGEDAEYRVAVWGTPLKGGDSV